MEILDLKDIRVVPSAALFNISQEYLRSLKEFRFDFTDYLFCRPASFYSIKLSNASNKLNISESQIIHVLTDAGYSFSNKSNIWLYDEHLAVLESYYSSSLKRLFKSFKKKIKRSENFDLEETANFFRSYIKDSKLKNDLELFECKLDDTLLRQEFYSTLFFTAKDSVNERQSFYFILRNLKFKISKLYKDLRTLIFSTLILNHYHIFADEEDNSNKHFKMKASLNHT